MKNKLLWFLAAVVAFDFLITILGQPQSYWLDPQTANEGNPVFRWFMVRGAACYFAFILAYIAGVVSLVSRLTNRPAAIVGSVFLLSHYFAACTWLSFHFHLNMAGPAIYALVLSVVFLSIVQPPNRKTCS